MDNKTVSILVCIVYFACLIGAGIYGMLKNKKASDYLVAGRKLNLLLTTATLAAVQIGAGIILGGAETGATWGIWPGMYYALGCGGGLILAGILVAHRMRDEEGYVPMDIFEKRFGQNKWVRIWAWLSNVPSMLGIFVAQMLACGSILAGFGVPFGTGVLMCSIVILIYSSIGGMWGVVLGDFVQIAIMTVGIPVAAVASLLKLSATGISPMSIYNTPFIPDGLFTKFIYLVVPFLLAISVSYDAFMRYQSAKDAKTARLGCILAGIFVIIFGIFASTIGAVARIIFPEMEEGLFAAMVMNSLHPVAAGIVLAAVLAAAMSSGNCLLISMGASFSRDLYNKFFHPDKNLDELPLSKIISQITVVVGCIAGILLAFKMTSILDAIIIFNYPYMGSLLIPLLVAVLWKGATRKGAFSAMIVGGIIGVGAFLAGIPGPLKDWVNPDMGLFYAYIASLIVIYFVSKMDKAKQQDIKSDQQ